MSCFMEMLPCHPIQALSEELGSLNYLTSRHFSILGSYQPFLISLSIQDRAQTEIPAESVEVGLAHW